MTLVASGFRRLSVFPRLQLCQGLRKGFSKNMACSVSVDNCDTVHPATDAYAGEAVEALKKQDREKRLTTVVTKGHLGRRSWKRREL